MGTLDDRGEIDEGAWTVNTVPKRSMMPVAVASALAGVGLAMGIAVAPSALAEPASNCTHGGGSVVCESPGNAQVYSEPPSTGPGMGVGANGPYGSWRNVPPLR